MFQKVSRTFYFIFFISLFSFLSCSSGSDDAAVYEITFQNISSVPSFTAQNRTPVVSALSSMIGIVHTNNNALFSLETPDQGKGLADLAENGDPTPLAQTLRLDSSVEIVGIAAEPSQGARGILAPGQTFTLILSTLESNARLSLASSFMQGNDIIVATRPEGVPLFDQNGAPTSGDITSFFQFYDIGTEVNQAPGIGVNQVLRQGQAPTGQTSAGTRENGVVRILSDGFNYPSIQNTIRVSIRPIESGNVSAPVSPTPSPSPSLIASPSPTPSAEASFTPSGSPTQEPSNEPSSSPSLS